MTRLLLIEDNQRLRDTLSTGLQAQGYEVDVAVDGDDGWQQASEATHDVVILDRNHIGVINDNNYPFSVGRHRGSGKPDDNEFILIRLDRSLGR